MPERIDTLPTPALLVDVGALEHNLAEMARALPGARLRPHVKATKCTALARRQHALGHHAFTCATLGEMEGLAAAGLGDDLLLPTRYWTHGVSARWTHGSPWPSTPRPPCRRP